MARQQCLKHPSAHRREPFTAHAADRFGMLNRIRRAASMIVTRFRECVGRMMHSRSVRGAF
jgi:hypothetical protein